MKGFFDAYALWPLDKMDQNWIVDQSTARNFTVFSWLYNVQGKDLPVITNENDY